jgi:hypothetical protein
MLRRRSVAKNKYIEMFTNRKLGFFENGYEFWDWPAAD